MTKSIPLIPSIYKALAAFDIEVDDDSFEYFSSSGRIVLLLDGFDELELDLVRETTLELEYLSSKFPELQIIVTSRPNNEIQKLSNFRIVEITPLTANDHSEFLRALGLRAAKVADIVHAISQSPSKISELITTPLMLTLVVFVYQSENQIPPDLPEFFDRLFHTVFTRHDTLKAAFERKHYSGLSERRLLSLFEAFCFMCMQSGHSRNLNRRQFSEAFDLAQNYVDGSACEELDFKKDITKVACLMLEEGIDETTFLHKSIAEYHAAAFIKNSDDSFAARFYAEAGKSWHAWQESLRFLQNIDAYRFAKYFAILNIREVLPLLRKLEIARTGKEVVAALPIWLKEVAFGYRREGPTSERYFCAYFGRYTHADNFFSDELSGVLSGLCFRIAPGFISKNEVNELADSNKMIPQPDPHEMQVPLSVGLELWGFEEFKLSIAAHIADLEARLQKAEELSAKLTSRARIFDRKK